MALHETSEILGRGGTGIGEERAELGRAAPLQRARPASIVSLPLTGREHHHDAGRRPMAKARKGGKKKLKARKQSVKDLSASKTASVKGGVKRVRVD